MVQATSPLAAVMTLVLATFATPQVDAHQRIMAPEPTYTIADKGKNWSPIAFMEGQYPVGPDLLGFIKSKGAKTLRDFMDNKSLYRIVNDPNVNFDCGWTDPKGPRRAIPANGMIRSSGYTHEGPCEIWLDGVRVLHGDNCNREVGAGKTSYKIDWSSCKGDCMLRWYWFGNRHVNNGYSWQVYKTCIPMTGSGGGSGAGKPATAKNSSADTIAKDNDAKPVATPVAEKVPAKTSKCKAKRD